jgi:phage shock protein C
MSRHRYDRGPAETHHGSARGARSKEPPRRSRLYRRPRGSAKIMGVCGGIADYLGLNASLVRFAWLVSLVMFTVPTLIGYFLLAWLLDEEPEGLFESEEEEVFWRHVRTEPSQTLAGLKHRFRTLELRLRDMEAYVTSPAFKIDRELR